MQKRRILTAGLVVIGLAQSAAVAGPFDLVHGVLADEVIDASSMPVPVASVPLVENGAVPVTIDWGADEARRVSVEIPRPDRSIRSIGVGASLAEVLRRDSLLSGPQGAIEAVQDTVSGSMDIVPTPGVFALVAVGGLGLIARRGG